MAGPNKVLLQAGYNVIVISQQGVALRYFTEGFWKSNHDFLIAFPSNVLFVMHGFRDNAVLLQAGYDVIAISPPGIASSYFIWRILKGRSRLYVHVQLTLFVYLERFRRYLTFLIWLGFPYWGGRNIGVFGAKWPPKRQFREKHLLGGHFLTPNCVFWAIVRELISIRLACAGAQEKNTKEGRKAGRKKSHKKWIFHVCVEQPLADGFQPNLAHVFVSRTLSNLHRYNLRGFGAVRCWSFHVAKWNQGRPNTLLSATALNVINYYWN